MIAWFFIFTARAESRASVDLESLTPSGISRTEPNSRNILERQAKPRSYTGKATRVAGTAPLPDGLPRSAGDAAGDPSSLVQEQSLQQSLRASLAKSRTKRGLLQADHGAVRSKGGLLERRSQIQALHQALQGSRRDDAAEKATLKRTFQYKAIGPDQNREQDFFLYELDSSNKYYETMDNWLKANKALIDRRLVTTKEGIKRNETYVKFVHDAEKKLWQELANSLVWTVRSYMDRDKIQMERMMEDMKTSKSAVAYQMKYQDEEFKKLFDGLQGKKQKLLDDVTTEMDKLNAQNTKIYVKMDDTNKAAEEGLKVMDADLSADMTKSNEDTAKKLGGLQSQQTNAFSSVFLTADKNLRLGKTLEQKIKETSATLKSTAGDASSSYEKVEKEATAGFEKSVMKGEKISERRLKGLSINLKKLTAGMERNASAAIKRLQDFKKKSLDEASTLQTDVDDNMTEIEENLQEKSEEYEEMLQDTEDTLKDAGAVQSEFTSEAKDRVGELQGGFDETKQQANDLGQDMISKITADSEGMADSLKADFDGVSKRTKKLVDQQNTRTNKIEGMVDKKSEETEEAAKEGFSGVEQSLSAVVKENDKRLKDVDKTLMGFDKDLAGYAQGVKSWRQMSSGQLEEILSLAEKSYTGNKDDLKTAVGDLVSSMGVVDEKQTAKISAMSEAFMKKLEEADSTMNFKYKEAKVRFAKADQQLEKNEGLLGDQFHRQRAEVLDMDSLNRDREKDLEGDLGELTDDEIKQRKIVVQALHRMLASLTGLGVESVQSTRGEVASTKSSFLHQLAQNKAKFGKSMDGESRIINGQLSHSADTLLDSEDTLISDLTQINQARTKSRARIKALEGAAQKLNGDITAQLSKVSSVLNADDAKSAKNIDQLKAVSQRSLSKITGLFDSELNALSDADRKRFKETVDAEKTYMDKVLADETKSFEERQAAFVESQRRIRHTSENLALEAQINNEELVKMNHQIEAMHANVEVAVRAANTDISAADIASASSEEALDKLLKDQNNAIEKCFEDNGLKLENAIGSEAANLLAESAQRMKGVALDQSLEADEREHEIKRIQEEQVRKFGQLAEKQAAASLGFKDFEGLSLEADSVTEAKMGRFLRDLKDNQFAVKDRELKEQQILQSQSHQLVTLVKNLMDRIGDISAGEDASLAAAEQDAELKMRSTASSIEEPAHALGAVADDALRTAKLAAHQQEMTEEMERSQLDALEAKVNQMSASTLRTTTSMRNQIQELDSASASAEAKESQFLQTEGKTIRDQLDSITKIIEQMSSQSSEDHERLAKNVDEFSKVVSAHVR